MSTNKTEAMQAKMVAQKQEADPEAMIIRNPAEERTAEIMRNGYWTIQGFFLVSACVLQITASSEFRDDHSNHFMPNLIIYLIFAIAGNWLQVEVRRDPGFLTVPHFDPSLLEEEKHRKSQNQARMSLQERKISNSDPNVIDLMVLKYYEENNQDCEMVRYPTSYRETHSLQERLIVPEPADMNYCQRKRKRFQMIELTLLSQPKKSFSSPQRSSPPTPVPPFQPPPHTLIRPHLAPFHLSPDDGLSSPSPQHPPHSASEPDTPHFLLQTRVISFGGGPELPPLLDVSEETQNAVVFNEAKPTKPISSESSSKGSSLRCKSRNLELYAAKEFKSSEKRPRKTVGGDRELGRSLHTSSGHFTFRSSGSGAFKESDKEPISGFMGRKSDSRVRLNSENLQIHQHKSKGAKFSDRRKLSGVQTFMNESKMSEKLGPTISEEDSLSDDRQDTREVGARLETELDQEGDSSSSEHGGKDSSRHSGDSEDSEQTQRGDHEELDFQKLGLSTDQEVQRVGRADLPTSVEEASARNTFLRANADLTESPPSITVPCLVAIRSSPVQHDCKICHIQQPFRTRHCRACGACVAKFDHHCYYLGRLKLT